MTPLLINMDDYVQSGEGANGASYNHKTDPSVMLKMYFKNFEFAKKELELAQKVYAIGIPTPEPGDLVTDGERMGIRFKRLEGKRSYARAVGDDPSKAEEYGREFAMMCKQLHEVHLDTTQFPNVKDHYLKLLAQNPFFTAEQKEKIHNFIKNAPDSDTALHGDLQFGNALFVDKQTNGELHRERYFIDLGDFCYGYPMFDLGMVYDCCCISDEGFVKEAFHMDRQTAVRFWKAFAPVYFGPDADLEEKEKEVRIYAGLKTLIIERDTGCAMPDFRALLEGVIY
ncbi:MAG: TIGR02172 family protein [Paludibacteraceae bacterium]|nr:TIGR02172 family protein [Paludibacteraceae bacterium]